MNKKRILVLILAIALFVTQTVYAASDTIVGIVTISTQEYYSTAFEILELVNKEREKEGVHPLAMDKELLEAAMLRANELGIYYDHVRPTNQQCFTACSKMIGENIAYGRTSASEIMQDWMNSEGHRSNILDKSYNSIGIGAVKIDGVMYWTQCFGMDEADIASKTDYIDHTSNREIQFDPEFEALDFWIQLDKDTLKIGETAYLDFYFNNGVSTLLIKPEFLKYQSSDERIFTVENGTIHAIKSGNAKLTIYLPKSPEISFEHTITVTGNSESTQKNPFTDVKKSDYYYDAVLWAYENGITSGTDATHFSPERTCTRAQVATFLWRTKGEPKPSAKNNPFVDVKESDYYYDAVLWAYENGITSGIDATHFAPDNTVERGQFVTFLWRAEGQPNASIDNPFEDVSENQYYTTAVLWAYENGITSGVDSSHFAPRDGCTRGQVAAFLYRAYH